MRYSSEHKAETRSRIVRNASRVLRDNGLNGIGIVGLMKAAGLTRGGSYAHFKSREALVAEAVAQALAETASEWRRYGQSSDGLDRLVAAYFTQEHKGNPASGCPLPAVSADVARSGKKVRRTFTQSLDKLRDALTELIAAEPNEETRVLAAGVMATMVGSLILARACDDRELAASMLEGGKRVVRSVAGRNQDLDNNRSTPRPQRCAS
jgi:TetR/AcrR family transcriptional regulator, transcriptional repressor for nem operon